MAYTKEQIKALLADNDKAVVRGILALYKRQTAVEQATKATVAHNGVGFSAADAKFLTSLAQWSERGYSFSSKQMYYARKCTMKYAGQLTEIANQSTAKQTDPKQSWFKGRG